MKLDFINIVVIILILINFAASDSKDNRKLQIGVKKRSKNCTNKSKKGDLLHVYYKGTFENGTEFDTNHRNQLFTFTVGSGQVIKGWDQGLIGMCTGDLRKLVIQPELAYGKYGVPPVIQSDTILIFHIELVQIERKNFAF